MKKETLKKEMTPKGRTGGKTVGILILAGVILVWALTPAHAQVSHLLRYQGTLVDSQDTPLEGPYNLTFRMYDAEVGGILVWGPEAQMGVPITKGTFSVLLGSIEPLNFPFDKDCYLSIEVNTDGEMTPRQRITPVATAIRSEMAEDSEKLGSNPPAYYLDLANHTGGLSPSAISPQGSGSLLDADTVDGNDTSFLMNRANHIGVQAPSTISPQGTGSLLDADTVDGSHASALLNRANHIGPLHPSAITPQGSGSGLDADSVDGQQAGTLLSRTSHTGTQLPSTISPQGAGSTLDADTVDGYDTSTSASPNTIPVTGADGYLPDGIVDKTALKTAVSTVAGGAGGDVQLFFTGTAYGFYPQIAMSSTDVRGRRAQIYNSGQAGWLESVEYRSPIWVSTGTWDSLFARMTYVTASGMDMWLFLLVNKADGEIVAASAAPDHPSYGNSGDPEKDPHPFLSYDPAVQDVVLVPRDQANALSQEARERGVSILHLVFDEYRVDMKTPVAYQPAHSGKFLDQDPVMIETIPDDIKVRQLVRMTAEEKRLHDQRETARRKRILAQEAQMTAARERARSKLKALGFTEEEMDAFKVTE